MAIYRYPNLFAITRRPYRHICSLLRPTVDWVELIDGSLCGAAVQVCISSIAQQAESKHGLLRECETALDRTPTIS